MPSNCFEFSHTEALPAREWSLLAVLLRISFFWRILASNNSWFWILLVIQILDIATARFSSRKFWYCFSRSKILPLRPPPITLTTSRFLRSNTSATPKFCSFLISWVLIVASPIKKIAKSLWRLAWFFILASSSTKIFSLWKRIFFTSYEWITMMDFWMKSGLESIRNIKKHHKDLYKYIVRIWLDWVKTAKIFDIFFENFFLAIRRQGNRIIFVINKRMKPQSSHDITHLRKTKILPV